MLCSVNMKWVEYRQDWSWFEQIYFMTPQVPLSLIVQTLPIMWAVVNISYKLSFCLNKADLMN